MSYAYYSTIGDNFYNDGVTSEFDPQWNTTYSNVYNSNLDIPWYSILGNHDYHQNPEAEIQYSINRRDNRWHMPDHDYTVIYEIPNSDSLEKCTLQVVFIDSCILAPNEISQVLST